MMKRPPIAQLDPDIATTYTPRQLHEHIASVAAATVAGYHGKYHESWWKKVTKRVAAEVMSFKEAVNEEYGEKHDRGEMWWQRAVRWLRSLPAKFLAPFRRDEAINDELDEVTDDCPEEGQPTGFKVTEGRASRGRTT